MTLRPLAITALLCASLASCGGGDGPDLSPFVGNWKVTMGTATPQNCLGVMQGADLTNETIAITTGADADLSATLRGCALKFNVANNIATLVPMQPACPFTVPVSGMNLPAMLTPSSGNITVSGTTATYLVNGMGSAMFGGLTINCGFMINATAAKQ